MDKIDKMRLPGTEQHRQNVLASIVHRDGSGRVSPRIHRSRTLGSPSTRMRPRQRRHEPFRDDRHPIDRDWGSGAVDEVVGRRRGHSLRW